MSSDTRQTLTAAMTDAMGKTDTELDGLGISRGEGQAINWGKIATIIWMVSYATDGDTFGAETGVGKTEYVF